MSSCSYTFNFSAFLLFLFYFDSGVNVHSGEEVAVKLVCVCYGTCLMLLRGLTVCELSVLGSFRLNL